jgi:hypothetical protein
MAAGTTLDVTTVRQHSRLAGNALRKRQRLHRQAQSRLCDARAQAAAAHTREQDAAAALGASLAAFEAAAEASTAGAASCNGYQLLARATDCDRAAVRVAERRNAAQRARQESDRAQATSAQCAQDALRAHHRVKQADEHLQACRAREHLAQELRAENELEDEPRDAQKRDAGPRRQGCQQTSLRQ